MLRAATSTWRCEKIGDRQPCLRCSDCIFSGLQNGASVSPQLFHALILALLLLVCGAGAAAANELTFAAPVPRACEAPSSLRLLLKDLEIPRNRAATIRAYAKPAQGEESFIGLLAVMGDSATAGGNRKMSEARVTATPAFRRWLEAGSAAVPLSVILRPFAGKTALKDLDWSVRAVEWACR